MSFLFSMLCRQDRESDRIIKFSFAVMSAIFKANNIAQASAEKMDESLGNRLIEKRGPDMATEPTFGQAFEPSMYIL